MIGKMCQAYGLGVHLSFLFKQDFYYLDTHTPLQHLLGDYYNEQAV